MNTISQGASLSRMELAEMEDARSRLMLFTDQQAEAIATHYIKHASMAMDLLKLVNLRKICAASDAHHINELIEVTVGEFRKNHRIDFGINLDWKDLRHELPQGG